MADPISLDALDQVEPVETAAAPGPDLSEPSPAVSLDELDQIAPPRPVLTGPPEPPLQVTGVPQPLAPAPNLTTREKFAQGSEIRRRIEIARQTGNVDGVKQLYAELERVQPGATERDMRLDAQLASTQKAAMGGLITGGPAGMAAWTGAKMVLDPLLAAKVDPEKPASDSLVQYWKAGAQIFKGERDIAARKPSTVADWQAIQKQDEELQATESKLIPAEGWFRQGLQGLAQSVPGMAQTLVDSGGFAPSSFKDWMDQGAGSVMREATRGKDLTKMTPEQLDEMYYLAKGAGAVYAGIEFGQSPTKVTKALGFDIGGKAVGKILEKAASNPVFRNKLVKIGMRFSGRVIAEAGEEAPQQVTTDLATDVLKDIAENPEHDAVISMVGQNVGENWKQYGTSAGKAFGQAIIPAAGMIAGGKVMSVPFEQLGKKGALDTRRTPDLEKPAVDLAKGTAKWEEAGVPVGMARELAKAEAAGDQERFNLLLDQFKRSSERKQEARGEGTLISAGKADSIEAAYIEYRRTMPEDDARAAATALVKGDDATLKAIEDKYKAPEPTAEEKAASEQQRRAHPNYRTYRTAGYSDAEAMDFVARDVADVGQPVPVEQLDKTGDTAASSRPVTPTKAVETPTEPATAQGIKPPSSPVQQVEPAKGEQQAAQGINVAAQQQERKTHEFAPLMDSKERRGLEGRLADKVLKIRQVAKKHRAAGNAEIAYEANNEADKLDEKASKLSKTHSEIRREIEDATTTGERLRLESELRDIEDRMLELNDEPLRHYQPITEEQQAKSDKRLRDMAPSVFEKMDRKEPLTQEESIAAKYFGPVVAVRDGRIDVVPDDQRNRDPEKEGYRFDVKSNQWVHEGSTAKPTESAPISPEAKSEPDTVRTPSKGPSKPPELMTPAEFRAALVDGTVDVKGLGLDKRSVAELVEAKDDAAIDSRAERGQSVAITQAALQKKPVSAALVEKYGKGIIPASYVREGDQYVFRPEPAGPAPDVKTWYRGTPSEGIENASGDLFFSASKGTAQEYQYQRGPGNKGEITEHGPEVMPKNPLRVESKEALAETMGLEDPDNAAFALDFDEKAKAYAQDKGHDGILYENGSQDFDTGERPPELHVFQSLEKRATAPQDLVARVDEEVAASIESGETFRAFMDRMNEKYGRENIGRITGPKRFASSWLQANAERTPYPGKGKKKQEASNVRDQGIRERGAEGEAPGDTSAGPVPTDGGGNRPAQAPAGQAAPEDIAPGEAAAAGATTSAADLRTLSDEAFARIIDGVVEEENAKPPSTVQAVKIRVKKQRAPRQKREASSSDEKASIRSSEEIIASLKDNGVAGADEAMKGLYKLFGGAGRVGMGIPVPDEETYRAAKPHFEAAYKSFVDAGKDVKDFVRYLVQNFGASIKPYLIRFKNDLNEKPDVKITKAEERLEELMGPARVNQLKGTSETLNWTPETYLKQIETEIERIEGNRAKTDDLPDDDKPQPMASMVDETPGEGVKENPDERSPTDADAGAVPGNADSDQRQDGGLPEDGSRWEGWLDSERSRLRREDPDSSYQLEGAEVDHALGADPEFKALAQHNAQAGFLTVPVKDTQPWSGFLYDQTIYVSRSPTLSITEVGTHERFHGLRGIALAQALMDQVDTKSPAALKYRDYLIGSHTAAMQAHNVPRAIAKMRATTYVDRVLVHELAADKYAGIKRKYGVNIDEAFRDLDEANRIVGTIDTGMRDQSKGDPELFASMQERGPPSRDYAELLQKLEEARTLMQRATGTTQAVERSAAAKGEKKRTRRKIDQIRDAQKERLVAAREKAGLDPLKELPTTSRGIESERQRVGFEEGKAIGHTMAVNDAITIAFREMAKESGVRFIDHVLDQAGAMDQYTLGMEQLPEEQQEAMMRAALRQMFGSDRYLNIRRATRGDIKASYQALRAYIQNRAGRLYSKGLKSLRKMGKRRPLHPVYESEFTDLMRVIPWSDLKDQDWHDLKSWYDRAKSLIVESRNEQSILAQSRTESLAANAAAAIREVESSVDKLKSDVADPKNRGTFINAVVDYQSVPLVRVLLSSGGKKTTAMYRIFYEALRRGDQAAKEMFRRASTTLAEVKEGIGLTEDEEVEWRSKLREFTIAGITIKMTPAEMTALIATSMRPQARAKLITNGFGFERKRGQLSQVVKGPPEQMEQFLDDLVSAATLREKTIAESMVRILTDMGAEGNRAAVVLKGYAPFKETAYFPTRIMIAHSENLELNARNTYEAQLENMGFTKEVVKHKNPLVIGDAFDIFEEHADKMSRLAHLSIPIRDIMQILGFKKTDKETGEVTSVQETLTTHFGTAYITRTQDTMRGLAGLREMRTLRGLPAMLSRIGRNAAIAILWRRPTSILANRIGGSILAAAELAHTNAGMATSFLLRASHPISLLSDEAKDIRAKLMKNGYLWQRWSRDLARVFSPVKEEESIFPSTARLKFARMQQAGLMPMANAELRNAIAMFRTLKEYGYTDDNAIRTIEEVTRVTQNPSTALEETAWYRDAREGGLGFAFPFLGQPTVARNMLVRDIVMYHGAAPGEKLKAARGIAYTIVGLAASMATQNMIRNLLYELATRGDERDKDKKVMDYLRDILDHVFPGFGSILSDTIGAVTGNGDLRNNSLIGQIMQSTVYGVKRISSGKDGATTAKGVLQLVEALGMLAGGPVGGPTQVARVVLGPALRTDDEKKRSIIDGRLRGLGDSPSFAKVNAAMSSAFVEARDAGVVKLKDRGKFVQSFYAGVERQYGEEFRKEYVKNRQGMGL